MPGCPGATASAWTLPWRAVGLQVPTAAAAGAAAAASSTSPSAKGVTVRDGSVRRAVRVMADLLEIGPDSTPGCPAGRVAIREGSPSAPGAACGRGQDSTNMPLGHLPEEKSSAGRKDRREIQASGAALGGARRSPPLRREAGGRRSGNDGEGKCYRGIP